jgi:hypothetical protein
MRKMYYHQGEYEHEKMYYYQGEYEHEKNVISPRRVSK